MKVIFNIIENYFFKYNFYYLFLLATLFFSINCHSIGNYPQVKKLNNGKYIVLSSTGIVLLDSTLTNEIYYTPINNPENHKAFIDEFTYEERDYIIIITLNEIAIFPQNDDIIIFNSIPHNLFTNGINDNIYSVIHYNNFENEYNFFFIYSPTSSEFLYFKGVFNSSTNSINFSGPMNINCHYIIDISFSCLLMKYNDKNVVNCFYGDGSSNFLVNYYPDESFNILGDFPLGNSDNEGLAFSHKSVVLPGKEKIILCSFSYEKYFYCYL